MKLGKALAISIALLSTAPSASAREWWAALAVGEDEGEMWMVSSYHQPSEQGARDTALQLCRFARSRSARCRVVATRNYGCLYGNVGSHSSGQLRWVVRATYEAAILDCEAGGFRCGNPQKACAHRY
jgi:hypothetical protein